MRKLFQGTVQHAQPELYALFKMTHHCLHLGMAEILVRQVLLNILLFIAADREHFLTILQNFSIHKYIQAHSGATENVQLTKPNCILFINQTHGCHCQGVLLTKPEKQSAISTYDLKFTALHRLFDMHPKLGNISYHMLKFLV